MSESSKYHPFTAADIERYHNGQMPPAERHALEKAALEDPFLADAIEGYAFTATPSADMHALKERLEEKLNRSKSTPLLSLNRWLQIAALFLVLAGSGWMVYHFSVLSKKDIATMASPKKTIVSTSVQPPKDRASMQATTTLKAEEKEPETSSNNNAHKTIIPHSGKPKKQARATTIDDHPTSADVASILNTENNTEQHKGSLSPTSPMDSNQGYFSMSKAAKTSAMPANANKPAAIIKDSNTMLAGRVAGVRALPDTVHPDVVLRESKEEMNEVVVTRYTKKKEGISQHITYGELEPAQGWANFDTYIAESLKEPDEVKEKNVSGSVELSFDVNKDGKVANIKVEKSLCSQCDEEAIRLLKEGPKWKKKKNKRGRVTIVFAP